MFQAFVGIIFSLFVFQAFSSSSVNTGEISLGQSDAPVEVVIYASYMCPSCQKFQKRVVSDLISQYVDIGKVRLIRRESYMHTYGVWASVITRCGDTSNYPVISNQLFRKQDDWIKDSPEETLMALEKIGLANGLTSDQIKLCLSEASNMEKLIEQSLQNKKADDINAVPTTIINGSKLVTMSRAEVFAFIEKELKEKAE